MRKAIRIAAAGVLVSSMAALGACAGPAKEKGNQMHGAGQSAVRGLERAGQETVRGVENAGRGVSQSARSGTRALERTGERITGYGMGVDGHHPYGASGYGMADGTTEIPSIDRNKKTTTYEHAGTTHGLGTSTYSLIGSSGLHSGGFSSHLQSRLKADGIEGVKVFVFDDHVILASSKRGMTSASYDPMQKKLLSGTAGFSGHGAENTKSAGTYGVKSVDASTLEEAKAKLKEYLGDQVDVDSIESSEAIGEWCRMLQTFGVYTPEMFRGLGRMYVDDARFTASIDRFGDGLAVFMRDAMAAYADRVQAAESGGN